MQYNDPYAAGTPPKPHQDNAHVQPVPQKHTVPEPVPQTTDTAVNKGAVPNTADLGEPENLLYKDPIHHSSKSTTQVIMSYGESVLNERPGPKYKAVKTLGKGGFGVVTLCERLGRDVRPSSHLLQGLPSCLEANASQHGRHVCTT